MNLKNTKNFLGVTYKGLLVSTRVFSDDFAHLSNTVVLLTHGAVGSCNSLILTRFAIRLAKLNSVTVVTFTATGNLKRRADIYASILKSTLKYNNEFFKNIYLSGRSMGIRAALYMSNKQKELAKRVRGVIAMSFPLLSQKSQSKDHRESLIVENTLECLYISGSKDTFSREKMVILMEREIEKGFNTFVQIEGANHSLSVKGRLIVDVNDEICDIIRDWTEQFDP